jgi:hypothetical protein
MWKYNDEYESRLTLLFFDFTDFQSGQSGQSGGDGGLERKPPSGDLLSQLETDARLEECHVRQDEVSRLERALAETVADRDSLQVRSTTEEYLRVVAVDASIFFFDHCFDHFIHV